MVALRQWLGWIFFLAVVPTAFLLPLARHMRQQEALFYAAGLPPLYLYFCLLAKLRLQIPGTIVVPNSGEQADSPSGLRSKLFKGLEWLRGLFLFLGGPALGAALLFFAVRDGETIGYFLGPALIWVCGGLWVLLLPVIYDRRHARRAEP